MQVRVRREGLRERHRIESHRIPGVVTEQDGAVGEQRTGVAAAELLGRRVADGLPHARLGLRPEYEVHRDRADP